MPTYKVLDIANYFLLKAQQDNQELLSNLKLQKLVYYAQGLYLALFGKDLFSDDVEAWQYGPVVPELYHLYKENGSGGIPANAEFNQNTIDGDTREFLDEVYSVFGQFSAIRLMELSHSDACWVEAGINNIISKKSMAESLKKYLVNE